MQMVFSAALIVWIAGCIGVGAALDKSWGTARDGRCPSICEYFVKPIAVLAWPIWIPGVATYRLVSGP